MTTPPPPQLESSLATLTVNDDVDRSAVVDNDNMIATQDPEAPLSVATASASLPPPAPVSSNNSSNNDDDVIDSALLSGLRDSRERLALFKLEQVLVDFCQTEKMVELDVGGLGNSVIRPYYSHNYHDDDGEDESGGGGPTAATNPNMTTATTTTRPATTFQRCLLHRLADRFQIARRTNTIPDNNGSGGSGGLSFIRLYKTPSTQIPSRLLVNVKPSEWSLCNDGTTTTTTTNGLVASTEKSSKSSKATTTRRNNKMKIMKRQDSRNNSSADGNSKAKSDADAKSKGTAGNPDQTERERQYAQARARIFEQSQEDAFQEGIVGGDEYNHSHEIVVGTTTSNNTPYTTSSTTLPAAAESTAATATWPASSAVSQLNVTTPEFIPSVSANGVTDASAATTTTTATTTSNKKATYRNRQVEQADPDFRRRRHTPAPIMGAGMYGYGASHTPLNTVGPAAVGYPPSTSALVGGYQYAHPGSGRGRGGAAVYPHNAVYSQHHTASSFATAAAPQTAPAYYDGRRRQATTGQQQQAYYYSQQQQQHQAYAPRAGNIPSYRRAHPAGTQVDNTKTTTTTTTTTPAIHSTTEFPSLS